MELRKLFSCLAVALAFSSFVHADIDVADTPDWLIPIIKENEAKKSRGVTIEKYLYNGQSVYVVSHTGQCCDLGATLYSESGTRICGYIGIAGAWEKSCGDFQGSAKFIKYLYEYKNESEPHT